MAVYTQVNDAALADFLSAYDLGTLLSFAGIAEGVENSNFLLRTERANYILTLYEKRVDPQDLPFFIEVMEVLAGSDMSCPLPVPARDGSILQQLAGRPAAVFSFLDGTWSRYPNRKKCAALGRTLASLHLKAAPVTRLRKNALGPAGWRPLLDSIGDDADILRAGMGKTIRTQLDSILVDWPEALPRGVIHADLFPNNVLFIGDELTGVIDFYFACNDMLAYDVAICLNAWCFEIDHSFNVTKARAFLGAYTRERKLSAAEQQAFPLLARGAAIRFLLTRLVDWLNVPPGALVKPKDPLEYVRKLRFHQSVKSMSDYGCADAGFDA